jgi:hypothetical protein
MINKGHEIFNKWGEILYESNNNINTNLTYKNPNEKRNDKMKQNIMIDEYSLKGYIKLYIVLQSEGDKSKVDYLIIIIIIIMCFIITIFIILFYIF